MPSLPPSFISRGMYRFRFDVQRAQPNPEKCWSGYTIVPLINDGVLLFDMNGNEVRRWNMHAMPPKLLPGGYVMGLSGYRHILTMACGRGQSD